MDRKWRVLIIVPDTFGQVCVELQSLQNRLLKEEEEEGEEEEEEDESRKR